MQKVLMDSINYLNTTNNQEWKQLQETAWTEIMDPTSEVCVMIKKGTIHLSSLLLKDITRMKLIAFPSIILSSSLDKSSLEPYSVYFNDERKTLLSIKKLLKTNIEKLNSDFPLISTCGILCHAIGESHTENSRRLIKKIETQKALDSGILVNIPSELIEPINSPLVQEINTSIHKCLIKKSNFSHPN